MGGEGNKSATWVDVVTQDMTRMKEIGVEMQLLMTFRNLVIMFLICFSFSDLLIKCCSNSF